MSPTNLLWTQCRQSASTCQLSHQPSCFLSLCQHHSPGRWYQLFLRRGIQPSAVQPLVLISYRSLVRTWWLLTLDLIFLKQLGIYFAKVFFANIDVNHMTWWRFFKRKKGKKHARDAFLVIMLLCGGIYFELSLQLWIVNSLELVSLCCSFEWELKPSDDSICRQFWTMNMQIRIYICYVTLCYVTVRGRLVNVQYFVEI